MRGMCEGAEGVYDMTNRKPRRDGEWGVKKQLYINCWRKRKKAAKLSHHSLLTLKCFGLTTEVTQNHGFQCKKKCGVMCLSQSFALDVRLSEMDLDNMF